MAKTPQQIQKELESIKQQALQIQSVVNERGEADISQVQEVEPVTIPQSNLRDVSIAFSGKADQSTMNEIGGRDPGLVAAASQFQNTGTFVAPEEQSVPDSAGSNTFEDTASSLTSEIRTLEEKMSMQGQNRSDAYEEAGVFDDMRTLNKLKDDLRVAQDRELEIPIEGRQKLRGRQATKTEFGQLTRPALEKNALEQLAASRSTSRLADTIETNLAVIDSQLKGENERDQYLYEEKVGQLETVQKAYADIITAEQKEAAEFQKFQYDLMLDASKTDNALRSDLLKEFAKSGRGMSGMIEMSTDELLGMSYENSSPSNWTNMSEEDAALYLDDDSYDRFTTFNDRKNTMTAEQQEAFKIKSTNLQSANSTIDLIEAMLDDTAGLKTSVGEGAFGRMDLSIPGFSFGKESNKFRANFKKLVSQKTLDKLLELKAAGGTLGAISEKELAILGSAAIALGSIENGEGNASGKSNLDEGEFKTAMETLRVASMKVYIAEQIGSEKYAEGGFVNMDADNEEDFDTIEKLYQDLKKTPLSETQNYAEEEIKNPGNLDTAFNLLREEEGLRTEAYQDQAGVWTIGIGNTQINGRPVQPGDRLTETQAETLMQQSVVQNYTNFAESIDSEMTSNQFAALTSFEYNLGSGVWQTPTGRQILSLVNSGQNEKAGRLMLAFNKHTDPQSGELVYNSGLAQRRMREANLLLS